MIKELYRIFKHEVCLNVTRGAVDSVRIKNIVKSGARVYDGGYIGIAGTIGEPSDELVSAAEKNLAKKIEYKFEPEKTKSENATRERRTTPTKKLWSSVKNCLPL